ncbi:MAG: HAMP domain-containing histidine kinase [Lachnospiraceae bacterium]|nr:HAMP domain-containing histidine kinase [Lachnospiraceae bacterium]
MGKKGWHGNVFVLISQILLLVFCLGLGGMTYIDSKAVKNEMEERIDQADRKCKKLLREFESGENDIEEDMFYFSQAMENIYDVIQGENIGFYGKIEGDTGETIYENGDKVFYHIYEQYEDEEGDIVFAETEQKILNLSNYLKSNEIKEISHLYKGQEEAAIAVEGYIDGVYIVPTKIIVLGSSLDADYEDGKYPVWKDKNGNQFYAQAGDNVKYYVRKTYKYDVGKGDMKSFVHDTVLECEFSFLQESEEDNEMVSLRTECQRLAKNKGVSNKTGIQKIQKRNEISLKETGNQMIYTFIAYPLQTAIHHLKLVYIFAAIIYVLVCYVIFMVIHTNIQKQRIINKNQKMLTRAIAHELKTPLSIIQGYCEGLQNQKSEEKKKEYIDTIIEESKEMNDLVLDMLELSKLENQNYTLDVEEIELVELTHAVIQQYESFLEEKQLQVEFYGEDCLLTEGDLSGMRKVISNLVSNGMKHTPMGGMIRVTFGYHKKKPEIRFFNNGSKIEENIRKHIWEGYYQSNENNGKMLRSSGLGLTIVGHILKLHHWKYGCENLEDGVEFWIRER